MTSPVHLILGGTGGIGSALARQLSAAGATPVLAARGEERLQALGSELGATTVVTEATQADSVAAAVAAAKDAHGRLDGMVCCVGSIFLKPAHGTSTEQFQATLDANLLTAFHTVRAAAPAMGKAGSGSIVLMSSAAAGVGLPNHEAIAAAKAGVEGLTRSAAASYAPRGVRINAVAPGLVDTPLAAGLLRNEKAREASGAMHPLGRIGNPDEIARAVGWLLDPNQSWITGQVVRLDGGLSALAGR